MADPKPQVAPSTEFEDTAPTQKDVFERPAVPKRGADKIPRQFGRYRIIDCLGRGGMGAVFKAQDTQLDRVVALKVPFLGDDEVDTRQRFFREARAAATVHHANICPVFDVGEFQGIPYLTMALIDGQPLHQFIAQKKASTPQLSALLMRKLVLAMQEAHNRGIIHRDLKPSNVIIRPNNEPTIMDFGLARRADDRDSVGLTQQGDIIGTVDYMSPEQVEGHNDTVGPAADIYALGVILYELLTGRLPFEGSTTGRLAAILVKEPPPPRQIRPEVPPKLEAICLKALAKKPADRFASMAQFAAALADYLRAPNLPVAAPVKPVAAAEPASKLKQSAEPEAPGAGEAKSDIRASKRKNASSRRRRSKGPSALPWVAAGLIGLLIVGGGVVAAILYSLNDSKDTKVAATPLTSGPAAAPPTQPTKPQAPRPSRPDANESKKAKPALAGVALRLQPDHVGIAVGQTQRVQVKLERSEYRGAVRIAWTAPAEARMSPAREVVLAPGQTDASVTLRFLAEPAQTDFKLELTATAIDEPQRKTITAALSVSVTPGLCARVIEMAGPASFAVETVAFTPNATLALVGGGAPAPGGAAGRSEPNDERFAIQVWNLERAEATSKLALHRDVVRRLAISADGKTGLSVSADDTVGLWDLALGQKKQQSTKLGGLRLLNAAISEDGKRGLIVYSGIVIRVNLSDFKALGQQPLNTALLFASKQEDAVRTVAVSADRKGLIGGINGKLYLLDLAEKSKPKALKGHDEMVLCTAFSPTEHIAASGGGGIMQVGALHPGKDNIVRVWDLTKATLFWQGEGHARSVVCLAFSADGRLLASGSADGEIRVWQVEDGKLLGTFTGHTNRILGLMFASDGKRLWSGAADSTLRQWKLP